MVKELTMDNSIFSLGEGLNSVDSAANAKSVGNEFEKVFETTTHYADKNGIKTDAQKVVKVAEKTVSTENTIKTKKDTASNITEVNKKVSKLSPKSPNATNTANRTQTIKQSVDRRDVNTGSDAYSFAIKEDLNASGSSAIETETESSRRT